MSGEGLTIWDRLASCVALLDEPFRASEIVGWFRRHHPDVNESSLRAHIQFATSNVAPSSKAPGFARRRPLITRVGHGVYVRYAGAGPARTGRPRAGTVARQAPTERPPLGRRGDSSRLILLACSSTKAEAPQSARTLYLGEAFGKGRQYAEAAGKPWYVLSGKWGLLHPDDVVAPYDLHLAAQSADYKTAWGQWVVAQLTEAVGSLDGSTVELLAGRTYVDPLRISLRRRGAQLVEPFAGLRLGEQLGWYARKAQDVGSEQNAPGDAGADVAADHFTPGSLTVLTGLAEGGEFEYRWPTETERFEASWLLSVERGGTVYSIRHCLGVRTVDNRLRRRGVTFVNGVPEVEGVAPDDYATSRCLVSPLKGADRTLIRSRSDVPRPYAGFQLVDDPTEIEAPSSRQALAVKLREDDAVSWAAYALARIEVRQNAINTAASKASAGEPARDSSAAEGPTGDSSGVVEALLQLGRSGLDSTWAGASSFTSSSAANQLLQDDPFAFLLGVVFDQGIPAERAWQAPFELKTRLGHLDPALIAVEEAAVWEAVNAQPKLHRFVERVPQWVVAAARLVVGTYGGDAGAIWAGAPSARELQRRLDEFPGIGQKKAAMAVEILERDLGVEVREMHGSDIAYDVHVRRVFLRTHLALYDDLDHMVEVGRRAHPDRPGAIDLPAWHIGRTWCRAGVPECDSCPLGEICPRDVQAADRVRGA